MGALILGGFAFIGYEIYQRATDPNHPRAFGKDKPVEAVADPGAVPGAGAIAATLPTLPAGSRIERMVTTDTRAILHITLPDGTQQIRVLDPRDGKTSVPITIPPGSSAPGTSPDGDPAAPNPGAIPTGAPGAEGRPTISDSFRPPATTGQ
mgnify:CR=1 FL=1